MLPNYFNFIFVHIRQKACLRPELSPKFLSSLGPNPARTRPEKPGPTYNSEAQRNIRNELVYSIEAQRFSAIVKQDFRIKSNCNRTFAIKLAKPNAKSAFLQF